MAGGYSVVVAGTTITASRENTYVSRQVITRFASLSAAQSAISTDAEEGMYVDAADTDTLYRYSGSAYVPFGHRVVGSKYQTSGTFATSTSTEVAMASWTGGDATITFTNGYIYRVELTVGAHDAGTAGTGGSVIAKVRKTVNDTSSATLGQWQLATDGGGAVKTHTVASYVKNASGADIAASMGITVTKLVGGNGSLYGDASGLTCLLVVTRLGLTTDHSGISSVVWAIT